MNLLRLNFNVSVKWYDFWVGAFYDRHTHHLYICPLPCIVIEIQSEYEPYYGWESVGSFSLTVYGPPGTDFNCPMCGKHHDHDYSVLEDDEVRPVWARNYWVFCLDCGRDIYVDYFQGERASKLLR